MAEMFGFLQVVAFLIAEGAMMCRWQISECSNQARTDSTLHYEVDDDDGDDDGDSDYNGEYSNQALTDSTLPYDVDDDQGRIMMIKVLLMCTRHIWTIVVNVLI